MLKHGCTATHTRRVPKSAVRAGCPPISSEELSKRDAFTRGYACALSDWIRLFNEPSAAAQVLNASGIKIHHLVEAGVEPYDLNPLRDAIANRTKARR